MAKQKMHVSKMNWLDGRLLRAVRAATLLSLPDFSKLVGLSTATVNKIERDSDITLSDEYRARGTIQRETLVKVIDGAKKVGVSATLDKDGKGVKIRIGDKRR